MARRSRFGREASYGDEIGRHAEPQSTNKRMKSPKGVVKVESDKGWLRLRFSHLGRRYAFAIGLPDTPVNRRHAAEKIGRQIELDILCGNFDSTLTRYKPQTVKAKQTQVVHLFQQFIDYKAKKVYERSLEKYQATLKHILEFFKEEAANNITVNDAEKFTEWLSVNSHLLLLRSD